MNSRKIYFSQIFKAGIPLLAWTIFTVMLGFVGCSKKRFPDAKDAERVFRAALAGTGDRAEGIYKILSFSKTDGFKKKSFFGREMYYAEYEAKIRWLKDCNMEYQISFSSGPTAINCLKKRKTYGPFGPPPSTKKKAGTTEKMVGKLGFSKTDKGWRSETGEVIEVSP